MQAIILLPLLVAQMCAYLVIAIIRAVGVSVAQHAKHKAIVRQVRAESAPARARLADQVASLASAQQFEMSLLTGALGAASPVRQARPRLRPRGFTKWGAMERNDVRNDPDAVEWVDNTFDPAGAVSRFREWHGATRSSLQGDRLTVFDRLFGAEGTDAAFARRLVMAQDGLALNTKYGRHPVDADFDHPAARMFVDRVYDIEHMRELIASSMRSGSTRAEAVEIVRYASGLGGGGPLPKALEAA